MTATQDIPPAIGVDPIKAIFDRALAAFGLILTSPLLGLVALAILVDGLVRPEDRGPVFYREERITKGERFMLLKFRTMQVGAIEEVLARGLTVKTLESQNRGDTPVGNLLRRFYLDELPQLLNILRGEMSFVGPRLCLANSNFWLKLGDSAGSLPRSLSGQRVVMKRVAFGEPKRKPRLGRGGS